MINTGAKLPLAVTCGDPAGVGPELIESIIAANPESVRDCQFIGPQAWIHSLQSKYDCLGESVGSESFRVTPGSPNAEGAAIALEAMERAALGCSEGRFRGVITGPVSKHWLQKVGFKFSGQTEFFANAWGGDPSMAFVGQALCVVLATWHIPLSEVPKTLDSFCLEKAVRRALSLGRRLGVEAPRIGVCGLNPHAGEGGMIGREERDVLDPTLDRLREAIPGLSVCLPGDTVFHRQLKGDFDVIVAAYHDQALAAVKTLEFDTAVNLTLGLPHIRTSPDHGTAFDIAGEGVADPSSFTAAFELARRLTANI